MVAATKLETLVLLVQAQVSKNSLSDVTESG